MKDEVEYAIVEASGSTGTTVLLIKRTNRRRVGGSDGVPAYEPVAEMSRHDAVELVHPRA